MRSAIIAGVGSFVPERVLTNKDLEQIVDTTDEWIVSHTGIRERRILDDDKATLDLAAEASVRALEDAGASPDDVEMIILATFTPDFPLPATANLLQAKLGCSKAAGFDLLSGCTGFVLGLTAGAAYIEAGRMDCVLVVAAEALTRVTNWQDRSTCVLFGDGAGAVVLAPGREGEGLLGYALQSLGEHSDLLVIPAGGSRRPVDEQALREQQHKLTMQGHEVFKLSVRGAPEVAAEALEKSGVAAEDVEWVIFHQANRRIMDAAARRLGIPEDRIALTIDRYGNTSAASMPITLDYIYRQGKLKPGDHVLWVAFGAGFSLGAAVTVWTKQPPGGAAG